MQRRLIWLMSIVVVGLGAMLALKHRSLSFHLSLPAEPSSASLAVASAVKERDIEYKAYILPNSVVHTLLIPAQSKFVITPAISDQVDTVEQFARKHQAIAVINGGFFDPINQQSTSHIVLQGRQVADPRQNDRLMSNPDLVPYLSKILDRSEFRRYQCGTAARYDIALHSEPILQGCKLIDALGGGPRLLPEITSVQEGFVDDANGQVIRDALGSRQPNARSAIGVTHDGSVLWVMAAQKTKTSNSGLSLQAFAAFMQTLGVKQALNLDGGSSSSLYYRGTTHYGKLDNAGYSVKRPVKSVFLVQPTRQTNNPGAD